MLKTPLHVSLLIFVIALLALAANGYAQGSSASAAGKIVFVMGTPQAINASGVARNLARGDAIYSGDRLVTGRGRLQVSMADGAFISVQPESEYVLDNYHYNGQPDGTEQAVYRLAKGGVRAVTGLIGRTNKEAYKVNTAVATIGIRGTGHNTRLCSGDCGNVKDGLYHNTWEGITYVVNDVDTAEVPAGQGVYVEAIDMPIIPLNQPSGVTAVATKTEKLREEEKKDTQEQDQTTLVSTGEQRTTTGDQTVIVRGGTSPSVVTSGLLVGVFHPDALSMDGISSTGLFNAFIFKDPNSNGMLGVLGLNDKNNSNVGPQRAIGTINISAVLGGDNPAAVSEAGSLLGFVDQQTKNTFLSAPAQVVETGGAGVMGWGRWANGYFVASNADMSIDLQNLVNNQSLHYIYGPDPGSVPTTGTAFYNFIGGTHSTSLSGATIGNGVTSGGIYVDFGTNNASLKMDVDHNGKLYLVNGLLTLDRGGVEGNGLNDMGSGVPTTTTATGSACNPGCFTYIDGGFFGSLTSGVSSNVGLLYDIRETDPIYGVAAFAYSSQIASLVQKPAVMVVVEPSLFTPGAADITTGYNAIMYTNAATGAPIGAILTTDQYISVAVGTIPTRAFGTVDLNAMKLSNDAAANTELNNLAGMANATMVADFQSNRATATDYGFNGSVGYGRWTNGKVLTFNDNQGTEVSTLTGNQSFHFIYGPDPGTIPTSGTATYNFFGGTHSTSISGATLGNGVTSGNIMVNFATPSASLSMVVNHVNPNNAVGNYNVSGPLMLATPNGIHDNGSVFATGGSGLCLSMCTVGIDGGFAGPASTTVAGTPAYIGIEYNIQESDVITGVAGFKN